MKSEETKSKERRPEISRSEWVVMQTVWKAVKTEPEVTASEILPEIRKKRKWNFSTAKTLLDRLVGKGFLISRLRGKTCFYRPLISQEQATRKSVASYLDDVLDGAFGPLVAYVAARKGLNKQAIANLEKLVKSH